jgi:hypothetical protein
VSTIQVHKNINNNEMPRISDFVIAWPSRRTPTGLSVLSTVLLYRNSIFSHPYSRYLGRITPLHQAKISCIHIANPIDHKRLIGPIIPHCIWFCDNCCTTSHIESIIELIISPCIYYDNCSTSDKERVAL